jgi:hypothetical protein
MAELRLDQQPQSTTANGNLIAGVEVGGGVKLSRLIVRALDAQGREVLTAPRLSGIERVSNFGRVKGGGRGVSLASLRAAAAGGGAGACSGRGTRR